MYSPRPSIFIDAIILFDASLATNVSDLIDEESIKVVFIYPPCIIVESSFDNVT
jgi:hypothetical protein